MEEEDLEEDLGEDCEVDSEEEEVETEENLEETSKARKVKIEDQEIMAETKTVLLF